MGGRSSVFIGFRGPNVGVAERMGILPPYHGQDARGTTLMPGRAISSFPHPFQTERTSMAKKKSKRTPGKKVLRKSAVKKPARKASSAGAGRGRTEVARAIELLKWVHDMTGKLCAGFNEHQMLSQPSPTDNHLVWQIGHMATGYGWFASMLDGKPPAVGEPYDKLFGWGSKPTGDAGAYPSHADVRRVHDEQYERVLRAASRMTDADAMGATATDSGGFAKNKLDVLQKCVWHEGWHQGQISSLRRALGLPGVMG
jgi:hypothetical protein